MDEQKPATAEPGSAEPRAARGIRDQFWFQGLAIVALVGLVGLLVIRVGHRDVVQSWQLLATCPADAGTAPNTVTTRLDISDCATTPSHTVSGRGWPIVPFVLSPSAGLDPAITTVRSDDRTRTMRIEYKDQSAPSTSTTAGVVLAFVEVPPHDIPTAPFTIEGASGPVTVTSVPAG